MTTFKRKVPLKKQLDEGMIGNEVHTKVRYKPKSKPKLTLTERLVLWIKKTLGKEW